MLKPSSHIFTFAPLEKRDLSIALLIAAAVFVLNFLGLGSLEFFRHTEADRSLIAWEMADTGEYLVPRLIHSVILTKPPLFYWLLASTIRLFGDVSEATLRLPSVLVSVLFALAQYFAVRRAGASRSFAALTTAVLVTGFSFFVLATVAEIDMTFGFFCALTFYLGYLSLRFGSRAATILAYVAAALAFLTKGPPIVFFYGAGYLLTYALFIREKSKHGELEPIAFSRLLLWNVLGVGLFLVIVSTWLMAIANQVGWEELERQLRVEIFERVLSDDRHPRGIHFYPLALISGLAPWSLFFVIGLGLWVKSLRDKRRLEIFEDPNARAFAIFNAAFLAAGIVMLTVAEGKSSRYLFPVFVCGTNLTALCILEVGTRAWRAKLYRVTFWFAALVALALPIAFPFVKLAGVTRGEFFVATIALLIPFLLLARAAKEQNGTKLIAALCLAMLGVRIGQWQVFNPHRNETRTVRPIVDRIEELVPKQAQLYNIELFERWVTYYLKRRGRDTARLTPEESKNPSATDGWSYLLLNKFEEEWRLEQLRRAPDAGVEVLQEWDTKEGGLLLIRARPHSLAVLEPHEYFPTVPSEAWYNERKN